MTAWNDLSSLPLTKTSKSKIPAEQPSKQRLELLTKISYIQRQSHNEMVGGALS